MSKISSANNKIRRSAPVLLATYMLFWGLEYFDIITVLYGTEIVLAQIRPVDKTRAPTSLTTLSIKLRLFETGIKVVVAII